MNRKNIGVSDQQVAAIFDKADTNSDGVISYQEAYTFISQNLDQFTALLKV